MKRLTIILAVACVAVAVATASPVWADRGCGPRVSFGLSIGSGYGYHGQSFDFGYHRGYYRPYVSPRYGYYDCRPYAPRYRDYGYRSYRYDPYPYKYRYSKKRHYRYRDWCD